SERLSAPVRRGDVLSSNGTIMRSSKQLLAGFHPVNAANDYGLDALYVWPNGEIWFSTEDDFQDQTLGTISAGDLLSVVRVAEHDLRRRPAQRPGLHRVPQRGPAEGLRACQSPV